MMQLARYAREPLYRNSLLLMVNHVVITGLGFFFWMVVARFYTEAEVGLGAAIISAMSLLALLSRLGLDIALIRFLPTAPRPVGLINSSLVIGAAASVVVAGVFVAGIHIWSPALGFVRDNAIFLAAFVLFTVCWSLFGMLSAVFVARRKASFSLWKNIIFSVLKIPLPIVLAGFFHAFGVVASWGVAAGIGVAISVLLLLPRAQPRYRLVPMVDMAAVKEIQRYSAGNYFASLLHAAPGLVLPLVIVNLLGPEQNAYFYVAWTIAGLLFAIPGAVSASLFVEGSHFDAPLAVNVRRSYGLIFLLLVPSIVVIVLAGKWLLLAFGEAYSANAITLLWVLALSSLFHGITSAYYSVLRVQGRVAELAAIYLFIAVAVLGASYFMLPVAGIVGVGYAWLGAQALVGIYVLLVVKNRTSRGATAGKTTQQELG